jgi:hypothetical protein
VLSYADYNREFAGMMPDRNAEQLAADIENELAHAKKHGTEGLLRTSPPRLTFSKGELQTILAALKKFVS